MSLGDSWPCGSFSYSAQNVHASALSLRGRATAAFPRAGHEARARSDHVTTAPPSSLPASSLSFSLSPLLLVSLCLRRGQVSGTRRRSSSVPRAEKAVSLHEDAFPLISLFAQSSRKILCEISFSSLVNRETMTRSFLFFFFLFSREKIIYVVRIKDTDTYSLYLETNPDKSIVRFETVEVEHTRGGVGAAKKISCRFVAPVLTAPNVSLSRGRYYYVTRRTSLPSPLLPLSLSLSSFCVVHQLHHAGALQRSGTANSY